MTHATRPLRFASASSRFARFARTAALSLGLALATLPFAPAIQAKGPAAALPAPQMDLPRIHLSSGMYRIEVQVAATDRQRQIGLMNRPSMPENEGMLFVFEQPATQCFWMRNTLLPLTAAFIDDQGTIVNLADMQPMNDASHCSQRPVRYVLEMNQGWFAKRKLQAGSVIKGLPGR